MRLSSNSIFHYTSSKDFLKEILKGFFKVSFCQERLRFKESEEVFQIPMVSFCEIPLSQVKDHIGKYGSYGIGLKREWAIRKRLNPVFYIEPDSHIAESYSLANDFFMTKLAGSKNLAERLDFAKANNLILDFIRYIKLYEGALIRKNSSKEKYRFSEEREWRFVPAVDAMEKGMYFDDDFSDEEIRAFALESIKDIKLDFLPSDIKYIVIKDDAEIGEFLDHLRAMNKKYSLEDVEVLTTRIITVDQIMTDF